MNLACICVLVCMGKVLFNFIKILYLKITFYAFFSPEVAYNAKIRF